MFYSYNAANLPLKTDRNTRIGRNTNCIHIEKLRNDILLFDNKVKNISEYDMYVGLFWDGIARERSSWDINQF